MQANEALNKLITGNQSYSNSNGRGHAIDSLDRSHKSILNQKPFAIILGCSD